MADEKVNVVFHENVAREFVEAPTSIEFFGTVRVPVPDEIDQQQVMVEAESSSGVGLPQSNEQEPPVQAESSSSSVSNLQETSDINRAYEEVNEQVQAEVGSGGDASQMNEQVRLEDERRGGDTPDTVDGMIEHLEKLVCEVKDALASITFRERNVTAEPHYPILSTVTSTKQDSSTYKTADSKKENSQPLPKVVNSGYRTPNNKMIPMTSSRVSLIDRWIENVFSVLREETRSFIGNIRMAINSQSASIYDSLLRVVDSRLFLEKLLRVYKTFYDGLGVERQTLCEALRGAELLEESLGQADEKKCETYAYPSVTEQDYLRQDSSCTQHWDPRLLPSLKNLDPQGFLTAAHLASINDILNVDNFTYNSVNKILNSTTRETLNFSSDIDQTIDGILSTPALLLEQRSVKRPYAVVLQEGNIDVFQWMNHTSTRLRRLTAIFLMIKRRLDFRYDLFDLLEEFQKES